MGQQQLLLTVLGVILVGIAVVVGINLFESNYDDRIIEEMVLLTQQNLDDAWVFFKKPEPLGGGGQKTFKGWEPPSQIEYALEDLKNMEKQNRGFRKFAQIHYRLMKPNKIYLRGRQYDDGRRQIRIYDYRAKKWKTIWSDIVN